MTSWLHNNRSRSTWRRVRLPGLVALLLAHGAIAAPYIPARDDTVLAQVPGGTQLRELQPLRRALADNPNDIDAALALSRALLVLSRREGDPRFNSYAQATLASWTQRPAAPTDALVLMAEALQGQHRFDAALTLLDRALAADPRHAQAWLVKATLLQVRGDFAGARAACARLAGLPALPDQRIAIACIATARGMNGHLDDSYRTLAQLTALPGSLSAEVRAWLAGQLGVMAVRRGDTLAAETHFKAALHADPQDNYIKGELADLYLRQSRPAAVIELLRDHAAQDALLLRLAIAEKQRGGERWARMFEARYAAAQRSGDATHLREHARYLLEVRGDATNALQAAQANWRIQRESADIRIYWQAALASGHPSETLAAWIAQNRYQDATLSKERP